MPLRKEEKRKRLPTKHCERCGKKLKERVFARGRENIHAHLKRRFCSLTCANTRGRKGTSRTQVMLQARGALKKSCECCGGNERLAIHHINENWRDNRSENLQTLCVYCHQQWHGLHKRLGIKCSTLMPPLTSLSVKTYRKIVWGDYVPTVTRSTSRKRSASSKRSGRV